MIVLRHKMDLCLCLNLWGPFLMISDTFNGAGFILIRHKNTPHNQGTGIQRTCMFIGDVIGNIRPIQPRADIGKLNRI